MSARKPLIVGSADRCATDLTELADAHGVDEVIAVTITHDHQARVHSYELLAGAFGLERSATSPAAQPSIGRLGDVGESTA